MRLVVAAGIEGQLPDELTVLGDHADPEAIDQGDLLAARLGTDAEDVERRVAAV